MALDYAKIKKAVLVYVTLPVIIFLFGWLKLYLAVIAAGLILIAVVCMIKEWPVPKQDSTFFSGKILFAVAAIALIWCYFAGLGGMFYQSPDYNYRNAIFRDLINLEWPVIYNQSGCALVYYIAHWLVPAAVGKIVLAVTSTEAAAWAVGNFALYLWSSLGVWLVLLLVIYTVDVNTKKKMILACLMFIFFSGLDVVGYLIKYHTLSNHLEWWAGAFQYSSITTCLFWVFNQTIVPWLLTLCIVNEHSVKNLALLGLLCLPYGPFPFIGLFVICICLGITSGFNAIKCGRLRPFWGELFSIQNILAVVTITPTWLLYYMSNSAIGSDSGGNLRAIEAGYDIGAVILAYFPFFMLEVGFYFILIYKENKKNTLYYIALGSLIPIALIQMGQAADFSMRVSIPAITLLACLTIRSILSRAADLKSPVNSVKRLYIILVCCFLIGAVTPLVEFGRGISQVLEKGKLNLVADSIVTLNQKVLGVSNFTCRNFENTTFFIYLAK